MTKSWLLVGLLIAGPVGAATVAPAADPLACPLTATDLPALPELGVPEPFLAACTATTDCPVSGGGTTPLTCSTPGSGTCVDFGYGVRCGSTTTYCGCYRPNLASCGNDLCVCDCFAAGGGLGCGRECRCPIEPF